MISVVIATYNSEKYIIQQLESIVQQTRNVDEVIIQDDCSTDNTINVVKEFIKNNNLINWKIESNLQNKGYISTFKEAIKRSNGDIIILCDHDDEWVSNKVEIIEKSFNENDNVLVLATSFIKIDENGNEIPVKKKMGRSNNNLIRRSLKKGQINKMSLRDIAIYNITPGCTCAFSSKIKRHIEEEYKFPHDWQIETVGACMDGLYYLDVVTTKYRIHSKNTIGLGHQNDYEKRAKLCDIGFSEKKEMIRLINNMSNDEKTNKDKKYMNRVVKVFELRTKMMQTKKIVKYAPKTLFSCIGLSKLYESVAFDIISIISSKRSKNK